MNLRSPKPYNIMVAETGCGGFCELCQSTHTLPMGNAKFAALELVKKLDQNMRLDFNNPPEKSDPRLSTDHLFGEARGKMFGTMVCQRTDGSILTLKSFSGQYNGKWEVDGWAPPLFDVKTWHKVNDSTEREIKNLGVTIDTLGRKSHQALTLVQRRKKISRDLMRKIHQLYTLHNFSPQKRSLLDVFTGHNGIPNGTADCCGPKLLNLAAKNNLRPLGLAEFYYGRKNKSGSREHGGFYPACRDKCGPIIGFMLCGLAQ